MKCEEVKCMDLKRTDDRTAEQNEILIPGLPTEIVIFCIARVPRSSHLNMSGVSRAWRNLLHGKVLSQVRCELCVAEEWLYLWTETRNEWRYFDLSLKKWSKLPSMPHDNRMVGHSAFASFDGKLFVIGGFFLSLYGTAKSYIPCRTVSYFDARTYCWKKAGDLNVACARCIAGVIENQLYVFGGTIEGNESTTITAEVYDAATDTWRFVSSMESPMKMRDSVVMEGKFYGVGYQDGDRRRAVGVVYDAKTDEWKDMTKKLRNGWKSKTTILNGRVYTVGREYPVGDEADESDSDDEPRNKQDICVYTPSKSRWERLSEVTWGPKFVMGMSGGVDVVNVGGTLCIVSIETSPWGKEDDTSMIFMVILEVKERPKVLTGYTAFRAEFHIQFEAVEGLPEAIKRCHTITL